MKSIKSAVSLAGVTAALGSMFTRGRSTAGVLGGAASRGTGPLSFVFPVLMEPDRGRDGVDPDRPFRVTNGSVGVGSLSGPVERMKSAKSLVDSRLILGSLARRPLRWEDAELAVGLLGACGLVSKLLALIGGSFLSRSNAVVLALVFVPVAEDDLPMPIFGEVCVAVVGG